MGPSPLGQEQGSDCKIPAATCPGGPHGVKWQGIRQRLTQDRPGPGPTLPLVNSGSCLR